MIQKLWNGSRFGKEFSANAFIEKRNKTNKVNSEADDLQKVFSKNEDVKDSTFSEVSHPLFDFSSSTMSVKFIRQTHKKYTIVNY
jgi:hypothetical protein